MCRAQTDREMVYLLEIKVQRDGFFKSHHCGCTNKNGSTINTRHAKCAGSKKKERFCVLAHPLGREGRERIGKRGKARMRKDF